MAIPLELATALAENGLFGAVSAADLQPLKLKGIAHDHFRIRGREGVVIRVPRQAQFAVSAEANLRYQTTCFARAFASGHTPCLIATLAPRPGLPMGALLVEEIRGRPMRLTEDLHKTAKALASIHRLAVPALGGRPPLVDHADPAAAMLAFIEQQWSYREAAQLLAAPCAFIEEELAWARSFVAGNTSAQPVTLIVFDSHPGNFLIEESGRAVFIDVEKMLYGSPAADLAEHTLYTATTWDIDCAGVLTPEATRSFHEAYFHAVPPPSLRRSDPGLSRCAVSPGLEP